MAYWTLKALRAHAMDETIGVVEAISAYPILKQFFNGDFSTRSNDGLYLHLQFLQKSVADERRDGIFKDTLMSADTQRGRISGLSRWTKNGVPKGLRSVLHIINLANFPFLLLLSVLLRHYQNIGLVYLVKNPLTLPKPEPFLPDFPEPDLPEPDLPPFLPDLPEPDLPPFLPDLPEPDLPPFLPDLPEPPLPDLVGLFVGDFVGRGVGFLVGRGVGWGVGNLVGRLVGNLVGRGVG